MKIEKPAPADPFGIPERTLGSLLQFNSGEGAISQFKVRGVVTYFEPGQGLYIQDGQQGLFIQTGQVTPVALGSQLEVVGYPASGRYSPKLEDAVFRVVGPLILLAPPPHAASDMIVTNDGFSSAPYDSILVQLKGRVIEEFPRADEDLLLFQDGPSVFTATLARTRQNHRALTKESLLNISGVCAANADEARLAKSRDRRRVTAGLGVRTVSSLSWLQLAEITSIPCILQDRGCDEPGHHRASYGDSAIPRHENTRARGINCCACGQYV